MHLRIFSMDPVVMEPGASLREDGLEMSGHSTTLRWGCSGEARVQAVMAVSFKKFMFCILKLSNHSTKFVATKYSLLYHALGEAITGCVV